MEEDLPARVSVLNSHVERLQNSRDNYKNLGDRYKNLGDSLHKFTDELLRLDSLSQIIIYVLNDAKQIFGVDIVTLALIDDNGDIAQFLEDDAEFVFEEHKNLILLKSNELLKATFNISAKPYLGAYLSPKYHRLFVGIKPKPISVSISILSRRKQYLGALNLGSYDPQRFDHQITAEMIEIMAAIITICLEDYLHFEALQRTSFVDNLTRTNNRRFFEQRLDEEIGRSQRNGQPLSCLFLDIDFFKSVNDTYGHQGGDLVLSLVAAAIKTQMRSVDVLARYGGEEFVALLSNNDESKALDIAERIRLAVESLKVELDDLMIKVTISIGSATFMPESSTKVDKKDIAAKLIKLSDTALYQAKHNGRNRVENGGMLNNS